MHPITTDQSAGGLCHFLVHLTVETRDVCRETEIPTALALCRVTDAAGSREKLGGGRRRHPLLNLERQLFRQSYYCQLFSKGES